MRRALLAALLLLLTACNISNQAGDSAGTPIVGPTKSVSAVSQVPNVVLADLANGEKLHFAELPMPTVITFWASWCTTCRKEFELWRDPRLASKMVGINVQDAQASESLRHAAFELMQTNGTSFPSYVDSKEVLTGELGIIGLPVTIVVDSTGRIIKRHDGVISKKMLYDFVKLS